MPKRFFFNSCCLLFPFLIAAQQEKPAQNKSLDISIGLEELSIKHTSRNLNFVNDSSFSRPYPAEKIYAPSLQIGLRKTNAKGNAQLMYIKGTYAKGVNKIDVFERGYDNFTRAVYTGKNPYLGEMEFEPFERIQVDLGYMLYYPLLSTAKGISGNIGLGLNLAARQQKETLFIDFFNQKETKLSRQVGLSVDLAAELKIPLNNKTQFVFSTQGRSMNGYYGWENFTLENGTERKEEFFDFGFNFMPEQIRLGLSFQLNEEVATAARSEELFNQKIVGHFQLGASVNSLTIPILLENTAYATDSIAAYPLANTQSNIPKFYLNYRRPISKQAYLHAGVHWSAKKTEQQHRVGEVSPDYDENQFGITSFIDAPLSALGEVNYSEAGFSIGPIWQLSKKLHLNVGILAHTDYVQRSLYNFDPTIAEYNLGERSELYASLEGLVELMAIFKDRVGIGIALNLPMIDHSFLLEDNLENTQSNSFFNGQYRKLDNSNLRIVAAYFLKS